VNPAPLRRGLIETRLLLEIRSGQNDAVQFALEMLRFNALEMSEFSAMVLLATSQDAAELASHQLFLRNNHVRRVTARISHAAFRLLTSLPLPSPLTADDAIVAATAIEHSLPLYALAPAWFANLPGLAAIKPY
jgi:predicted nucleic acid-binding protein